MYGFSTKLDVEKHGYDGLARIIQAAGLAQLIRFHPSNPPNSRSILGLQKNGRDAETCAVVRAVIRAVVHAEDFAKIMVLISSTDS